MTHTTDDGHHHLEDAVEDPQTYWENRYAGKDAVWSGRVNATLVEATAALSVGGRALELGCGEGGDAVWLAEQGWTVTAVDISATAVERGRAAAATRGPAAERITWVAADLATWAPPGPFELVTASFLHSTVELPRIEILRTAAGSIAAGGHLLVISHAEPPPWAPPENRHAFLPSPEEDLAALALPEDQWQTVRVDTVERTATGPDGQTGLLRDGVILLRRR